MQKLLVFLGLCASVLHAGDSIPTQPVSTTSTTPDAVALPSLAQAFAARPDTPTAGRNLWRISLTALAVSNALDVQSSWGKHELNSTLASPSGNFGAQGALLKLGIQGGLVGIEYLFTRHRPSARLYRTLAIINFGASAATGGTAAHNYTVALAGR